MTLPASPRPETSTPPCSLDELIGSTPLPVRISPALVNLALRRIVTWTEAEHVLDALEAYDEHGLYLWAIRQRLLAELEAPQ